MPSYDVTLDDRSIERIHEADAYQQEGPLTTFFRTRDGRGVVDSWSTRLASFRTAGIVAIRLEAPADTCRPAAQGTYEAESASALRAVHVTAPSAMATHSMRSSRRENNARPMARGNASRP